MDSTKKANFPTKRCGVLGCTGSVGQRFILLLALHPHFELHVVGASERSAGKKYKVHRSPLLTQHLPIPCIGCSPMEAGNRFAQSVWGA